MKTVQLLRKQLTYKGFALLLTVALFSAAIPTVAMAQSAKHVVAYGNTLSHIAVSYGVSLHALMEANHIYNADHIYVGQRLIIPGKGGGHSGGHYNNQSCNYHKVKYGQTLSHIAYNTGVSLYKLADVNGIYNTNRIYAGQTLCIPSKQGHSSHNDMGNNNHETAVGHTETETYALPSTGSHEDAPAQYTEETSTPETNVPDMEAGSHNVYTTTATDSWETLAAYYGTTAEIMATVNGLDASQPLGVGIQLKVPVID